MSAFLLAWLAASVPLALLLGATIAHLRRCGLPERIEPHVPCDWDAPAHVPETWAGMSRGRWPS